MIPGPVGIVGAGAVGQAVGAALVCGGLDGRLLMASRTIEQAAALAADLDDMRSALGHPATPQAAPAGQLQDCAAVIIAVRADFTNRNVRDVRLAGAVANAHLIRDLADALRGYDGVVLVVTNPVDLMTRLFAETSGCSRVFGIGSNLDSARYRLALAAHLGVPLHTVEGHVIGEHGDRAVVCASATRVNGRPAAVPLAQIREHLAGRPGLISKGVGRTRFGPAAAVLSTLNKALGLVDGVEELAVPHGQHLGIPVSFTSGEPLPCLPDLDARERAQLRATEDHLRTAYQALQAIPTLTEERMP